jgi:hypothetical protein
MPSKPTVSDAFFYPLLSFKDDALRMWPVNTQKIGNVRNKNREMALPRHSTHREFTPIGPLRRRRFAEVVAVLIERTRSCVEHLRPLARPSRPPKSKSGAMAASLALSQN